MRPTLPESPGGKRQILREAVSSLSRDPLSVQFLGPWFWSLLPGHSPLEDALPWMTFRAIRWLEAYLRPDMTAFEYGSGGSTMFLGRRVRRLVTIENDLRWHAVVAAALRRAGIRTCDLRLVPAEPRSSAVDAFGPTGYEAPEREGSTFESYVRTIDEFPDQTFDLVSVDGYARPACVARAVPKVRHGGYLLLDNSDWAMYREAIATLAEFPRMDFPGVGPFQPTSWRTSVWRM